MTSWNPINTAPRNGRPLLLWARFKSSPPGEATFYPVVGFWHRSIDRWKVAPEDLNGSEELIATHWAALPEPPNAQD